MGNLLRREASEEQTAEAAPENFVLQKLPTTGRPPPAPPRILKHQVYTDPDFFKEVDDHTIAVANVAFTNFRDLIWNLVFKKKFNELEKARAIFRWMTLNRKHKYSFHHRDRCSPDAILQGYKNGTKSAAQAVECLALYAGLHCIRLRGWVKGVGFEPGISVTSKLPNHSWNALYIDGDWQFIESQWATASDPASYRDFYFLPDPAKLIFTHFSEDPAWQLHQPCRSRAGFNDSVTAQCQFFDYGMQFLRQDQAVIYTHNGILVLTLGFSQPLAFIFHLKFSDDREDFQGKSLRRYVVQETTEFRVSYYVRMPRVGDYLLEVYAQPVPENLIMRQNYTHICTYKIICEEAASCAPPFPRSPDISFGPGVEVRQLGLTSYQQKAILLTSTGNIEVLFEKSCPVTLHATLCSEEIPNEELTSLVSVQDEGDWIYITCELPMQGEYGLCIFVIESHNGKESYSYICQYLVTYSSQDKETLYGMVYDQRYSRDHSRYNYILDVYNALTEDPQGAGLPEAGMPEDFPEDIIDEEYLSTSEEEQRRAILLHDPWWKGEGSDEESETVALVYPTFRCPICMDDDLEILEEGRRTMSTKCGHIFCDTCILDALERQKVCPTCRKTLCNGDIHTIYL